MSTLSCQHLQKTYRDRSVVKDVSMQINCGEIIGLLGPNGAGKTTSFYMLVGLVKPNIGTVMLDGEDITDLPMHERARKGIGYLPQEKSIFRKLSVSENIMAILELRDDLNKQERHDELEKLLGEFNIQHIRDSKGQSLSGGETRRVEIARALAINPRFILLDEPFAGIDPISVVDIKKITRHLSNRGIGILITDHNVRETLDLCHKAYIASNGKIIAHGTAKEILQNAEVRSVYLGDDFDL